jgi:hypothetical protein
MKQGHSGSTIKKSRGVVEKRTTYAEFGKNLRRQRDLMTLTARLPVLPTVNAVNGDVITMEFVDGTEGMTERNAHAVGSALRILHEQRGFGHRCDVGADWVLTLANENLARASVSLRIPDTVASAFPDDALIHGEPTQIIERHDGGIVFVDIEEIGWGSRYRDIGFVEYIARMNDETNLLDQFLAGYNDADPIDIDRWRIRQMAGITAIAYARFASAERRIELGIRMMKEAEQHLPVDALQRA